MTFIVEILLDTDIIYELSHSKAMRGRTDTTAVCPAAMLCSWNEDRSCSGISILSERSLRSFGGEAAEGTGSHAAAFFVMPALPRLWQAVERPLSNPSRRGVMAGPESLSPGRSA
eukprot:6204467-Pleurochrysis_carterae.AAC.1